MTNEELKKKIVEVISQKQTYGIKEEFKTEDLGHGGWQAWTETTKVNNAEIADALIEAGIGDVKEIKYRVRRAEKALYIACRETAEIIFKDDFDRHAQEYMYGYLKQAEKELAEEGKE